MNKTQNEIDMAAYAASIENALQPSIEMPAEKSEASSALQTYSLQQMKQISAAEAREQKQEDLRREIASKGTGMARIPLDQLPSKGMFYPADTQIFITSATIGDIKRWTSMNEDDIDDVTTKMQDIIESCCRINFGASVPYKARWKDLIDIDRLYILFAIHDYTFQTGKNDVKIKVDEKTDVILKKENVKFIEFPEKLMKFYNADKRCFSFPVRKTEAFADTDGKMDIYITTIGVADWLKDYIKACEARHDNYDKDFVAYASLLISNWRYITSVEKYYDLIERTRDWSAYEWSLISRIRDVIGNAASTPVMKYLDNGGAEREVPLYFRDGFKSLFQLSLDIDL